MGYIQRNIDKYLTAWKESTDHKPLLLRGARQIGKTSTVRNFGKSFKYYLEIDLNEHRELHQFFSKGLKIKDLCRQLSFVMNVPIEEGNTLLFIDEIQSCPDAINSLRYFYEQWPELHLIAAGSLLEFALSELPSFGVGRIRSIFMYPFSFEEFLNANNLSLLVEAYKTASPYNPLMDALHSKLLDQLKLFLLIGGMPKAVSKYVETQDLRQCQEVLNDLVISYQDDFSKYNNKVPTSRINEVFNSVALQSQGKFVYSSVNKDLTVAQVKTALELLIKAGLVHSVMHTSANGIPLGAEVNPKYQRMILLDTGIIQRILHLDLTEIMLANDFKTVNRGAMAEIFVATELMKAAPCTERPQLYCWHVEKKDCQAEVDFVVQRNTAIIPIEVKSGNSGSMQSLRIFMSQKKIDKGIRTSLENFAQYENIEVIPLYAISNIVK